MWQSLQEREERERERERENPPVADERGREVGEGMHVWLVVVSGEREEKKRRCISVGFYNCCKLSNEHYQR